MAQSKFTLYKYVKMGDGSWRYKKAAFYSNGKIKPNVVVVGKNAQGKPIEETHAEGSRLPRRITDSLSGSRYFILAPERACYPSAQCWSSRIRAN